MDLGYTTGIECDNMQTIRAFNSAGSQFTTKLRHVEIHHHWLRQEVQKKTVHIKWVPTTKILADGLTKALLPQRHKEFIKLLGLHKEGGEDQTESLDVKGNNKLLDIPLATITSSTTVAMV